MAQECLNASLGFTMALQENDLVVSSEGGL